MIEITNDDIIKDIKEKIKRNPKYTHPCNREFQEDIKKYGFKNGNKFISWMQQNGILKSPTDVDNEWARKRGYKNYVDYHNHLAREKGFVNLNDRRNHLAREKGFINLNDYKNHLTREKGFESLSDYYNHLAQKRGFKNQYNEFLSKRGFKDSKEYRDNLAQEKGFRDNKEYRDQLAQEQGYRNHSEYQKNLKWNRGDCSPTFENKDCSAYLGIHIVEKKIAKITLEIIFEYVEIMPNNNPGFDFICKNARQEFIYKYPQFRLERRKEYKIDIKSATVDSLDKLQFAIRYNDIPDYFLSVGFNNRENLDISAIWLIKSDEQIRINRDPWSKVDFWNRKTFTITNRPEYLFEFQQYELICKLEKLKERIEQIRSDILHESKSTNI